MSTSTLSPHRSTPTSGRQLDVDAHLTFARIVRSEWIKFRTLRSTVWTLGVTVVVMVAVSIAVAFALLGFTDQAPSAQGASDAVIAGYYFGQLTLGVLGVLAISGEYSTGMIRSTFCAVPTRLPTLGAKALVLAAAALIVSLVSAVISALVTVPILAGAGYMLDLGNGETLRIILGCALYLCAITLMAFGLGALLRNSAAALSSVFGLLLVVPTVFGLIPGAFAARVASFLPSNAGAQVMATQAAIDAAAGTPAGILGPWQGFGILLAWVIVILGIAAVLLRSRDA